MPLETFTPKNRNNKNENDGWAKALAALLILLSSFACVFCSAQSALWFIDRSQVDAQTLASNSANYASDAPYPLTFYPRVNPRIGDEAQADLAALAATRSPDNATDPLIALIPVLPTPTPTMPRPAPALPQPTLVPTPTTTPPVTPVSPPPTSAPPPPTTAPPPTSPPVTSEPTLSPPTAAPTQQPTVPPATPPTTQPPTVPPTQPATVVPTATSVPSATNTPIPPPSVIFFSSATYSLVEGGGAALITVMLDTATPDKTITVNYLASNGSAIAPGDYTATNGTLTFAPNQTVNTFSIPIIDDALDEPDETIILTLSAPSNGVLGSPNPATLTILDNDFAPSVQFDRPAYSVAENGTTGQATITATLSSASALAVTVNYLTSNGTALAGQDYTAVSGTLTFNPGQTSKTFSVPIINDFLNENDETVALTLSNPGNAGLGSPNPATLTIVEDDFPTLQFKNPSYSVIEATSSTLITATLSAPSDRLITATYASSNNSALAGRDYLTSTGLITFASGLTETTFTVDILDDSITNEFTETATLTLSNPLNATLGSLNPAFLAIIDDDGQPAVSFVTANYSVNEGNDGSTGFITNPVTVILDAPSAITVSVTYAAGGGSATAGADYVSPVGGTLTFAPNQTGQSFDVVIINDPANEPDETINLTLSNPVSATLGLQNATITIFNDDAPGPAPCSGSAPAGEPDIGPPDGEYIRVGCGANFVLDMGATPIRTDGTTNYDMVFYELRQPDPAPPPGNFIIFMDWVVVQVGPTATGPWYTVFFWGDGIADTNSNLGQFLPTPTNEADNRQISTTNPPLYGPAGPLNLTTGIAIDVDARVPPGSYPFVRFYVPPGGDNDVIEVDAVHPLP